MENKKNLGGLPDIIDLALETGLLNYVDNETPRRYFISGHADEKTVEEFGNLVMASTLIAYQSLLLDGFLGLKGEDDEQAKASD